MIKKEDVFKIGQFAKPHVMFLMFEVITRRKPSDKFLEYAQVAGMCILFALLLYANANDILRYFFK